MNMKTKYFYKICVLCSVLTFFGCKNYLTEAEPGVTRLDNYYTSGQAAIENVTGCYVPLMWEYNSTYYPEWFIGDVVSDDALKGGQSYDDMASVYEMENWKVNSNNEYLRDFYRAQYQGIARCNMALTYIPDIEPDAVMTASLKARLLGEVHFLRAYYYFRLVRVFGGVPIVTTVQDDSGKWELERSSITDVFALIVADLKEAEAGLWLRSDLSDEELGRATKGAAQAMLQKVYLYMAGPFWSSKLTGELANSAKNYVESKAWGQKVIESNQYKLNSNYKTNFILAGENSPESVFEIQYAEVNWGDYGSGNGFTAGSFTQILVRSRSAQIGKGWGFNHPTWNLYNEYEEGDVRRDTTIFNPPADQMEVENEETYLGSALLNRKYAMYDEQYGKWTYHHSRGPLNNKQIRYADVLLMYAEACLYTADENSAKQYIDVIRERVGLPTTATNYSITINGQTITTPTTEQLLKHERRMELAMEGHRWFDIVRWGKAKEIMDAYKELESVEAKSHMGTFREGVNELFPIPSEEIELNPKLTQNYGY